MVWRPLVLEVLRGGLDGRVDVRFDDKFDVRFETRIGREKGLLSVMGRLRADE